VLDVARTGRVATIPSRGILYAKIGGVMIAPVRNVASAFISVVRSLGYALSAYRDKVEESS